MSVTVDSIRGTGYFYLPNFTLRAVLVRCMEHLEKTCVRCLGAGGWTALLVLFCLMTAGMVRAGEQPPLDLAVPDGPQAFFTAPRHYLPSEVTFALGEGRTAVKVTGVELLGAGPVVGARYETTETEQARIVTTHLTFESGAQAQLVTLLAKGAPSLSLALTGDTASLKGLVLHLDGLDRLIFKEGDNFTVRPVDTNSNVKTVAGSLVVGQNTASQEGLSFSGSRSTIFSISNSGRQVALQAAFLSTPPLDRALVVSAFRGDSLLAYERAQKPGAGYPAKPTEPAPAAGTGPDAQQPQQTAQGPAVGHPEFWPDRGRAFARLKADPREAYFRFGFLNDDEGETYEDMNFGGDLGLLWLKLSEQEDLSLTVRGLLTARFDVDSESFDLMNTDFIGGVALGYRRPLDSLELFVYHQSSHLGDEVLHRGDVDRIDYAREAVRLLWAHQFGPVRVYAGPTFNLHALPEEVNHTWILQTGAEYEFDILGQPMWAAADIQSRQEQGWNLNSTLQLGLELGNPTLTENRQFLFTEFFAGHSNMGQFWDRYESYQMIGIGYEFK